MNKKATKLKPYRIKKAGIALRSFMNDYFAGSKDMATMLNTPYSTVHQWLGGYRLMPVRIASKLKELFGPEFPLEKVRPDYYECIAEIDNDENAS